MDAVSLDEIFPSPTRIALAKIDVEGHEASVLEGSQSLLRQKRIRDIVFEEHNPYPCQTTNLLEANGCRVFQIGRVFTGPRLLKAQANLARSSWEPTSFLATREPERSLHRAAKSGWDVLSEHV